MWFRRRIDMLGLGFIIMKTKHWILLTAAVLTLLILHPKVRTWIIDQIGKSLLGIDFKKFNYGKKDLVIKLSPFYLFL